MAITVKSSTSVKARRITALATCLVISLPFRTLFVQQRRRFRTNPRRPTAANGFTLR
jgi:hypothetical protein